MFPGNGGGHVRVTALSQMNEDMSGTRTGSAPADLGGGTKPVAKVTMPQLGESVAEGTIGKWLKKPGDHVAKYEPLLEVITDKVNAEVPSPFEGTLTEILVEEGETVPNNAEIAVIDAVDRRSLDGSAGRDGCRPRIVDAPERDPHPAGHRPGRRPTGRRARATGPPAPTSGRSRRPSPAAAAEARGTAPRPGRRPDDPGRPASPPRAWAHRGDDRRDRRRRADHPRRRHRSRRGRPDRSTGRQPVPGRPPRPAARRSRCRCRRLRPLPDARLPPPAVARRSPSRRVRTRSSSR